MKYIKYYFLPILFSLWVLDPTFFRVKISRHLQLKDVESFKFTSKQKSRTDLHTYL